MVGWVGLRVERLPPPAGVSIVPRFERGCGLLVLWLRLLLAVVYFFSPPSPAPQGREKKENVVPFLKELQGKNSHNFKTIVCKARKLGLNQLTFAQ